MPERPRIYGPLSQPAYPCGMTNDIPMSFNDWAEARAWDSLCDPELRFEAQTLVDALALWRRHAGDDIPRRSALTARELKPVIGNVAIFERVGRYPSRYRVRLMGTRVSQVLGEMQGRALEDVLSPEAVLRWSAAFDETLKSGRALRFVSKVQIRDLDFLESELLLAPLLDDLGDAGLVFTVAVFHAVKAEDAVFEEISTALD